MTDWLLALVPTWGPWLLGIATFASCLALPVPASILMLAAGGFVAAGDLAALSVGLAALAGAVAGDLGGYLAGRVGGKHLLPRLGAHAAPLTRATDFLARRGGLAVFLSRWAVSALGPYVNIAAGAAGQPITRFAPAVILGESVWVALYIGLGWGFAGNLAAATAMAGSIVGFAAALAAAGGLGWWLLSLIRAEHARR